MLTETVVIFAVLFGLMILISVLGGSTSSIENFQDEVVLDGPPEFQPGADTDDLKSIAERISKLATEDEKDDALDELPDAKREVVEIMLDGIESKQTGSAAPSNAPSSAPKPAPVKPPAPKPTASPPNNQPPPKKPTPTPQTKKAPVAGKAVSYPDSDGPKAHNDISSGRPMSSGKNGSPAPMVAPASDTDMIGAQEAPPTIESFSLNAPPMPREHKKKPAQAKHQHGSASQTVEPFAGPTYALF